MDESDSVENERNVNSISKNESSSNLNSFSDNSSDSFKNNKSLPSIVFPFLILETYDLNYYFKIKKKFNDDDKKVRIYYKTKLKLYLVEKLLACTIIALTFINKPSWCRATTDSNVNSCFLNKYNEIFFSTGYFLNFSHQLDYFCFITMIILIFIKNIQLKEMTLNWFLIPFLSLDVWFFILKYYLKLFESDYFLIFRVLFCLFIFDYIRIMMILFCKVLINCKKIFFIYFFNIFLFAIFGYILFFDYSISVEGIKLYDFIDFSTFTQSLWTIFIIQSGGNFLEIVNYSYSYNVFASLFFIFFMFVNTFIVNFIIYQIITYVFEKIAVKTALKYPHFKDILLTYFGLEDYINNLNIKKIRKYNLELISNPKLKINDFKKLNNENIENGQSEKLKPIKEEKKFLLKNYENMNNNKYYNLFFIIIDIFISLSPIIILSFSRNNFSKTIMYTLIQYLIFFSTIHPIFRLIYNFNKNISDENTKILYNISLNIGIFICSLMLPNGSLELVRNIEQSNKILFAIFGIICFIKFLFILEEVSKNFPNIQNIIRTLNNILIFLKNMFYILVPLWLIFMIVGQVLFGGNSDFANSNDIHKFKKENLMFINFNGYVNSFWFIFSLFLQNNINLFIKPFLSNKEIDYIYIITANLIFNFLIPKLIVGFIIYSLINKINSIKNNKKILEKLG